MWKKLLCRIRIHNWTNITLVVTPYQRIIIQECERCGKTERVNHFTLIRSAYKNHLYKDTIWHLYYLEKQLEG